MPIKLSGELVEEARSSAKLFHRSLTGQIEHWAALGRAIESQMPGETLARLLEQIGGSLKIARVAEPGQRQQVAVVLAEFLSQSPGADNAWLHELTARGVPFYGSEPGQPNKIVRLNPDGSREAVHAPPTAEVLH